MTPAIAVALALQQGVWSRAWPFILVIVTSCYFPALAVAASSGDVAAEKVQFDVPAGDARPMLRRFARQANREIVFAVDSVTGVRTHAVKGEFTTQEALGHLLAETGLVASLDTKTGAISVRRQRKAETKDASTTAETREPQKKKPSPPTPQDRELMKRNDENHTKTMKKRNPFALLGAWLALMFTPAGSASAQDDFPSGTGAAVGQVNGRVQNLATGRYLNNARVSVRGTDLVAFTDQFGNYRLPNVPAGPVVLEVFYTNLDVQEIPVTVPAGGTLQEDVGLISAARYGEQVVQLDPFRVAENREMDADALAVNEQRFAPNIKNVIAADALGEVFGSAPGDFLKFLPGIAAEYNNAEVEAVNIRGLGGGLTAVHAEGAPLVSGKNSGATRQVDMRTVALNNVSRIEVIKVPTPATPADTLGGLVNFVNKSAFERSKAELRVGLSLSGNMRELSLGKSPHGFLDEERRKVQPGFDFDYTLPITPDFGIVLTGIQSNNYHYQDITTNTWRATGPGTGATTSNPYYQQFLQQDFPRFTSKEQYSFKADWRVTPNSVLSVSGRWSENVWAESGGGSVALNAGTNGNPVPATGQPLSYGPDFTDGATGRAIVRMTGNLQNSVDESVFGAVSYRFDDGTWMIDTSYNYSSSFLELGPQGGDPFYFGIVQALLISPARLSFTGVGGDRPATLQAFDNNGEEIDLYDIDSYRMFQAIGDHRESDLDSHYVKIDVNRRIDRFAFPVEIQFGGAYRLQSQDIIRERPVYRFTGTNPSPRPYQFKVFVNDPAFLGLRPFPDRITGLHVAAEWEKDPSILTQSPVQVRNAEQWSIDRSQYAEEEVTAYYLQGQVRLMDNRLTVLGGVRFENTDVSGLGLLNDPNAVFVRNPDGSFARDEEGDRIRKPEAGAPNSVEELRLVKIERGFSAESSYDGYYPSLHLTYNITENFQARLAYARSYGRPDFPDIIPSALVNEADLEEGTVGPDTVPGNITVSNTGLKPWTADNYDFSLEYYTEQGGVFSAGVFLKEITDFFGDQVKIATLEDLEALGLDLQFVDWNLRTKFNSGDARITGIELNARHSLRNLGDWGQYFTVFANGTKLKLEGNPFASFRSFIPETANFGFIFSYKRLTVQPRLNYRGRNRTVPFPALGEDGFNYIQPRKIVDLSINYQLTKRFSLTFSAANIFKDILRNDRYSSDTPEYARRFRYGDYGTKFSLGIKGVF